MCVYPAMEKGRFALLALVAVFVGAAGCASTPAPTPVVAPVVAETRTTSAVMLGAPVTLADGPRTTIPSDAPR